MEEHFYVDSNLSSSFDCWILGLDLLWENLDLFFNLVMLHAINNNDGDSIVHKGHISTVGSSRKAINHALCKVKDENCCQQKILARRVEENFPSQKMQPHFCNSSICINACISLPFGNIHNISYGNHFSYNCILYCEFSVRLRSRKFHHTKGEKQYWV